MGMHDLKDVTAPSFIGDGTGTTITSAEYAIYKADFDALDKDGSGFLNDDEISELIAQQLGAPPAPTDLQAFMNECDRNGDGKISMVEYLTVLLGKGWEGPRTAMMSCAPNSAVVDIGNRGGVLKIVQATWGLDAAWMLRNPNDQKTPENPHRGWDPAYNQDVTVEVQSLAKDGRLAMLGGIGNLLPDPAPGQMKEFCVHFTSE